MLRPAFAPTTVHVAFCCDPGYLRPLTAAVVSLLASARRPGALQLWLLTDTAAPEAFAPIEELVRSAGASIEIVTRAGAMLDPSALSVTEHLSLATYYRLRLPDLLPLCVRRVIYLDADLVVRAPIEELWSVALDGAPAAAAANPRATHFARLGLRAEADYFNAGVMLLDLDAWRREDLHGQALAYAAAQGAALRCHDQDALNHVLAGRWRALDLRWNQQFKFFQHPSWFLRVSPAELRRARREPFIVHYTTPSKPWHYDNDHPWRWLFFHFLDRTPFRGWRPSAPASWRQRLRRRLRTLVPHPLRSPFWRYNVPPRLRALKHRLA